MSAPHLVKLDARWHRLHPMPRPASPAQRLAWHLAHAKHCGCRAPSIAMLQSLRRAAAATAAKSPPR
jgi:hypothetical protein